MAKKRKAVKIKVMCATSNSMIRVNGSVLRPPVAFYVYEDEIERVKKSLNIQKVPNEYILVGDDEIKVGKKLDNKSKDEVEKMEVKTSGNVKNEDKSEDKKKKSDKSESYKSSKNKNKSNKKDKEVIKKDA